MTSIKSSIQKMVLSVFFSIILIILTMPKEHIYAKSSTTIPFVILSCYRATLDIGEELYIIPLTSTGKLPTWKSSDTKIASVNTYGKIIAKKRGSVNITAKINKAEATCKITVNPTNVTIQSRTFSIERGSTVQLSAKTSNNSTITWSSSRKSVATIDSNGLVTGRKPGETTITAKGLGGSATCKIKVNFPTVKLEKKSLQLYRNQTYQMTAKVSSDISPQWKINKKSVALIDQTGTITALKNGSALITATVDGISSTCELIVKKPSITLAPNEVSIKKGTSTTIKAHVSSSNTPIWSTSNSNIATVNAKGTIVGVSKGRAYIYASEDGTKVSCIVYVTE